MQITSFERMRNELAVSNRITQVNCLRKCPWLVLIIVMQWMLVSGTLSGQVIEPGNRVLFLGDSNTYAGTWVDLLDAWQRLEPKEPKLELLNLGLSSETACGLSEPSHPFPRPDVRERLERALAKLKPDVVVVCYGMNDGIYHPFLDTRFEAYKSGIREVCSSIKKTDAKVVLITPPPFDPLPLKKRGKLASSSDPAGKFSWEIVADDYHKTIGVYAKWIRDHGKDFADQVVDVHSPLEKALDDRRVANPDFAFSGDGVHFDSEGHRLMAKAFLKALGHDHEMRFDPKYMELVTRRQRILRDAYLTHVGHKRPGLPEGMPIEDAQNAAMMIETELQAWKKNR